MNLKSESEGRCAASESSVERESNGRLIASDGPHNGGIRTIEWRTNGTDGVSN